MSRKCSKNALPKFGTPGTERVSDSFIFSLMGRPYYNTNKVADGYIASCDCLPVSQERNLQNDSQG